MKPHMDWIADIKGKASGIVHSMLRPNCRARLGVGGYAAWIVVGNTGNKSWPQPRQGVLFQRVQKIRSALSRCEHRFLLRAARTLRFTQNSSGPVW